MRIIPIALAGLALVGGCTTAPLNRPVEVLRYHTDLIARGTIAVEPPGTADTGADYRAYADAVQGELAAAGFTVAPLGQARYSVSVSYHRGLREAAERGSSFSIGLGGGSYGRHGGVGGGVGIPIGGNKLREVAGTELAVRINERGGAGAGVVWEGRAMTEADTRLADALPETAARKLANALFRGFPGESGRTITVR